ncbi:right-handed parallel beta-helix repeat-containing protein [Candidatus Nitrosocosmicus hydrocola]|uniref:right-handed parallel beta-helix repeat-containing protein n=1 Tax=Candidatus Nitrosocosmicus hydrocola TaxID=1826872 RepID=UPI000ADCEAD8|nr:right-handed parallel beta-helix repeat-containing protein [Candidatus Nitrosocosmicus hydrocola]
MTNKSTIIISGFLFVLLVTCNSTNIFLSNTVFAQYYEERYQGSIFDFVCDENDNSLIASPNTDELENSDDSSGSSDSSEQSDSSSPTPSNKPGKVISPTTSAQPTVSGVENSDDSSETDSSISVICDDFGELSESNTIPSSNSDVPVEQSVPSVSCGQVIHESVELSSNLECNSDGILVTGDDITVDLNGFTLTGPSQNSSKIGIMATDTNNVTIHGPGSISDFQAGVLITAGENSNISSVDLQDNHVGAFVSGSSNSTITDNRLTNNSIGIASYSSSNSEIVTNLFESNTLAGTTLVESSENNIHLNTVQDSVNGIFTDGQSHGNNITYNNLEHETQIGINNNNGLPTNINDNAYYHNSCNVSLPNGLCYGNEQPSQNSNPSTVEAAEQPESTEPTTSDEVSSNTPEVESDEATSTSPAAPEEIINGLGSGTNVAVQSQSNEGSISAGQDSGDSGSDSSSDSSDSGSDSSSDSSDSGSDSSSDSSDSGSDSSSDSSDSGSDSSSDSTGSGSTTTGSGETGSQTSGTTGGTTGSQTGSTGSGSTTTGSGETAAIGT